MRAFKRRQTIDGVKGMIPRGLLGEDVAFVLDVLTQDARDAWGS